jgi:hypothetical protein
MITGDKYWIAGGTKAVPSQTVAGARFVAEHSRLLGLEIVFSMTRILRDYVESPRVHLEKSVREAGSEAEEAFAAVRKYLRDLESHEAFMREVVLTRVVDNFLCFITDLLALIYKTKPEMLKSSEQERLDFIFQYPDMDELRSAVAEKRVERLAYLGLRELADYIKNHMGFELFQAASDLERAALVVEFRNVIVHNRGCISAASVRRFPVLKAQIGKRLVLEHGYLRDLRQFVENAAIDIDVRATGKFGLPAQPLRPPLPEG